METYSVGGKVVHPCYGAGTIFRIQEKTIADQSHTYYVINTVSKSMQVMVPVKRAQSAGLRYVGEPEFLRETLSVCSAPPEDGDIEKDLHTRQADMREDLKSGCYGRIAEVVRVLFFLHNRRPLGTVDRQLLDQGKDLLASELAVASDCELKEAIQEIESYLARMLEEDMTE
jgi:CarD family transcriptional regulator